MWKLILFLAFGLWLAFSLAPETAAPQADVGVEPVATTPQASDDIREITLETGETWQVDRVIEPGPIAQAPSTTPVSATPDAPEPGATPDADVATDDTDAPEDRATEIANADILLLYVTGDRVNLRAGPSTDNAIVTALTRGTATEYLADAPDGWFQIRDQATGNVGFMSGDFLSPTRP